MVTGGRAVRITGLQLIFVSKSSYWLSVYTVNSNKGDLGDDNNIDNDCN